MLYSITNETLKSRAQDIQKEFENGGASWEGVALEIARTWDGSYCANEKDITHYDPKCCTHDYESGCPCCLGDCDDCQDEQNIQAI